ncbi:DUF1127 domain-containing protein [Epibacterium ulvae]|uniref:DUF1127 domain-containing protein n=1 Tax=Epibacterium ulvae TaxID=1156985 RepID=UPI002493288C|nr:DUF1127 domain-containing protein [Epibacterium ulvae]
MAVLNDTSFIQGNEGFFGRARRFVGSIVALIETQREANKTRRALGALNDRELADIGLCRSEIELVACGKMNR